MEDLLERVTIHFKDGAPGKGPSRAQRKVGRQRRRAARKMGKKGYRMVFGTWVKKTSWAKKKKR